MAGNRNGRGAFVSSARSWQVPAGWRQITMKNIILAPAIVIGCAVIGAIVGALYFAAVLGVLDWMVSVATAADNLGRRASFPAFAFGVPAGAVMGGRLVYALLETEETYASFAALILAGLVALPCIGLPLYASAWPAFKVLVLASGNMASMAVGYASIMGVVALALGSNKLIDAHTVHRTSSSR
ncbi:MAG: hypothetical protein AB7U95_17730 [Reyranella sp.]